MVPARRSGAHHLARSPDPPIGPAGVVAVVHSRLGSDILRRMAVAATPRAAARNPRRLLGSWIHPSRPGPRAGRRGAARSPVRRAGGPAPAPGGADVPACTGLAIAGRRDRGGQPPGETPRRARGGPLPWLAHRGGLGRG